MIRPHAIPPLDAGICASHSRLSLPHHNDPFDRMLIWTAITQPMTLLSKDQALQAHRQAGLRVIG